MQSDKMKRYKLKKDLPDLKASPEVVFERVGDITMPTHRDYSYSTPSRRYWYPIEVVENSPEWFEPVPVSDEGVGRIEVDLIQQKGTDCKNGMFAYTFTASVPEIDEKSMRRVLETTLNNDPLYTQQEMDAARTEAFWASREKADNHIGTIRFHDDGAGMYYYPAKFTTAADYLSTLSMSKEPPSSTPEQKPLSCNICGSGLVLIRGQFPADPKRHTCPTCVTERLEHIHEISGKNYGQTSQSKQQ